MMPEFMITGLWDLLSGSGLLVGAIIADAFVRAADAPHDCGGKTPPFIGLITVVGFLAAYLIAQH